MGMTKGRVLSVASECVPLIKTGGLADVVGALPLALAPLGWDMRVMLPAYPGLPDRLLSPCTVWQADDLFGGRARVLYGTVAGHGIYLLEAAHLYGRAGGIYGGAGGDYDDNPERFAALSWAAAEIARDGDAQGWRPTVLHAHDWQAGLAPAYLRYGVRTQVRSVLTVHNIAFQGMAPAAKLGKLRLPISEFHSEALEYYGQISALKAGLVTADAITTVSPTYAEELMRPEFGLGLEGVISSRAKDFHGILNGVDEQIWSPATDQEITPYSATSLKAKAINRAALIHEFGLDTTSGPLAIFVSRLTHQKGVDLLVEAAPEFLRSGGALAILGSGDPGLEAALATLATQFPGRVGLRLGYDEALSHRMFAGGDAVLVPSRFEPCGLTQMYGLRYGTIPVVAATGGLNDTVIGATPASLSVGAATGISFHPVDSIALSGALRALLRLHADRVAWTGMMRQAMKAPVGWTRPAGLYAALYQGLLG